MNKRNLNRVELMLIALLIIAFFIWGIGEPL